MAKTIETKIDKLIPDNLNGDVVLIYLYRCHKTGVPIYVGKTIDLNRRIKSHLNDSERGSRTKFHNWLRLNKGAIPEIIEVCNNSNWKDRERFWIEHFRSRGFELKNTQEGGQGIEKGHMFEGSTLKRMSEAAKNKFSKNSSLKEKYVRLYGKLDLKQIEQLFVDYHENRISTNKLTIKSGVPQSTITQILSGKRYAHLSRYFVAYYGLPYEKVSSKRRVELTKSVCQDYLSGLNIEQLVERYKIPRATLFDYIKSGTGKTFRQHQYEKIRSEILREYNSGRENKLEIASSLGCDYTLVCKVLKKFKMSA